MDRVCIFDVNETLLDLAELDPIFAQLFGDAAERPLWFRTVLQTSLALTLTGCYRPFAVIMSATLGSRAAAQGRVITTADEAAFKGALSRLPLHADVVPALKNLRAAGYRLAALTNSGTEAADAQLQAAGVRALFEAVFSTDEVAAAKPAPAPYLHAARRLAVPPAACWLVAAHAWDTHGAKQAGLKAALVRRPSHGLNDCFAAPDVDGDDLPATAAALIGFDQPPTARMTRPTLLEDG